MKKFSQALLVLSLVLASTAAFTTSPAGAAGEKTGRLGGAGFSLQNYFNAGGELTPFFDQIDGTVESGIEIGEDYIYDIDFRNTNIVMRWNKDEAFDIYEPYVGAAGGLSKEEAAAAPIADEYHITFDRDISDLRFSVKPNAKLQPNLRIEGTNTLVVSIPGGTEIGDGINTKIKVRPPVRKINKLGFSLQNYFNAAGDLTPFFDPIEGSVRRGAEVNEGYIYNIDLAGRRIAMTWNTDPSFDLYEPHVGAAGGLSKEEAAAAPIADEYHFTFSEKVSHLTVTAETSEAIVPELRFEDDYTLVIAIPGGTAIGDGLGLEVALTK